MYFGEFNPKRIFRIGLYALSITFVFTLVYALAPRDCAGIGCSPELNVGRFHFTTPLIILLIVQVIGIIGLSVALFIIRRKESNYDAFASLANNSSMFKLNQNKSKI